MHSLFVRGKHVAGNYQTSAT